MFVENQIAVIGTVNHNSGATATRRRDFAMPGAGLRDLEGRQASLALADGSRLDAVLLLSARRGHNPTVWLYGAGIDVFVPRSHVIGAWESPPTMWLHRAGIDVFVPRSLVIGAWESPPTQAAPGT